MTGEVTFHWLFNVFVKFILNKRGIKEDGAIQDFLVGSGVLLVILCIFTGIFVVIFARLDAHHRYARCFNTFQEEKRARKKLEEKKLDVNSMLGEYSKMYMSQTH
jgi:hypothetical protein